MCRRSVILFILSVLSLVTSARVISVSLLTCAPGEEIYELEGHTALRLILDDGRDLTVNWGTFDFNSPNFLYRFVKGETDYRMSVYPFSLFRQQYAAEGRSLVEQELELYPQERDRLLWLIDSTLTVGSPVYRYNYVKDNCATRPIDYLEKAIGGTINLVDTSAVKPSVNTFRGDMTAFHERYPWYQFGIDLALGSGIDYELTPREHMFAPVSLQMMLENSTRTDSIGNPIAFVRSQTTILPSKKERVPGTPFPLTPLFAGWLVFAIALIVSFHDVRKHGTCRLFDTIYYNTAGLAGLLLTFLIFVSVHESTSPNWLYLWLNPLCFIGGILIWLKKCNRAVICWQIVNFVALLTLTVIAIAGVQKLNPAFIPLIAADAVRSIVWILSTKWEKGTHRLR